MNIMGRHKGIGQRSESIRIFAFGDVGAGKSTFLACLIQHFLKNERCLFVFDHDEKPSKNLMMLWLDRLKEFRFPPISQPGHIFNIKIGLIDSEEEFKVQFSLYEMSGEDLKKIATRHGGDLEREFQEALENSNVILALVPRPELTDQEMLLGEFFNFLYNQRVKKPVAIIVTKWDLTDDGVTNDTSKFNSQDEYQLERLTKENLNWPIKFLEVQGIFEDPAVFYFTVGSVDKSTITAYKPRGLEEIAEWIIQNSIEQKSSQ